MGGGAMLPPFTNTVGGTNSLALSSICNAPFDESWTKCRCIDHGSSTKTLEIESFGGVDEKGTKGFPYDFAFGSVPSTWEVEKAMSDLQSLMNGCYDPKEEMNSPNVMLNHHHSTLRQSPGYARLYDAVHMLQNEPSTQKLVLSIASDEAVWKAMMNNKAVQGSLICAGLYYFLGCYFNILIPRQYSSTAKEEESQNSTEKSDIGSLIVKWIMSITTSKLSQLIQVFSEMFEPSKKEKPTSELSHLLEEKIRSSFLISVVLVLIVVMTRSQGT